MQVSKVEMSSYEDLSKRGNSVLGAWLNNSERKRKRRVAKYKMYALEGKMKNKWKKGLSWFKIKYTKLVHGY